MNIKINLNIFFFLILFIITNQIEIYALIMCFGLIHEIGHLLCGFVLKFEAEAFKIMPLGFSVEFKTNLNDYNKKILHSDLIALKKLLITLAGPITNIIIIIVSLIMKLNEVIIYSNLVILLFNLIPIYPLDGGRIIKNLLKILVGNPKAQYYQNKISNIFVLVVTVISSITIYYYKNICILLALIFIWVLNIRENKKYNLYQKIYKLIDKKDFYL